MGGRKWASFCEAYKEKILRSEANQSAGVYNLQLKKKKEQQAIVKIEPLLDQVYKQQSEDSVLQISELSCPNLE